MRLALTVFGLLAATFAVWAQQNGADDQNGDGKPDRWLESKGSGVEYRADSDFDGRVDVLVRYGSGDRVVYEEYDYNFDGEMDDFYFYENGVLSRREVDSNFDGKIDIWLRLKDGMYVERLERDTDFDGVPDVVKEYGKAR